MNKVYHVRTQEAYDALMEELEKQGYAWWSRYKHVTKGDFWWVYKENTCVKLGENKNISFDDYDTFKALGYEITEYKEPKQKFVYHTPTQEAYDALMVELEKQGYTWGVNANLPQLAIWEAFKKKTCIAISKTKILTYGSYVAYQALGYEIIEYKALKAEKKAMKLEDVFTSKRDEHGNMMEVQKFCTKEMKNKQELYHEILRLEETIRSKREYVLKDLEEVVAEEHKALIENVEQLDKALMESAE